MTRDTKPSALYRVFPVTHLCFFPSGRALPSIHIIPAGSPAESPCPASGCWLPSPQTSGKHNTSDIVHRKKPAVHTACNSCPQKRYLPRYTPSSHQSGYRDNQPLWNYRYLPCSGNIHKSSTCCNLPAAQYRPSSCPERLSSQITPSPPSKYCRD